MKSNNIIISSNSSWNIYNFRINLIKNLLYKKYKLFVVVPNYDSYSKYIESIGCKIVVLKFDSRKISIFEFVSIFFKYFNLFYNLKPKYYLSFTIKPNIIGTLSAIFFKVKVINNITGMGSVFIQNKYLLKFFILFLYKIIFIKSYIVFFQNMNDLKYFLNQNIIKKNKAKLISGSGINLNLYKYNIPINKIEKNYNFLYFGRVISEKGILELLEAIPIIKNEFTNITFNIVGDTDSNDVKYDLIIKLIEKYKNDFNYFPYTDDIKKFIKNADCVILPSYREGLPRSLLESAALGVPIMASNVPGCNEIIINNKTGLLFNVKDTLDIVKKIKIFIKMSYDKKLILSKNARKKIEDEFDENFVIQKYNQYIR